MDKATFELAYGHVKELDELCASDNLSLSALQQIIDILDESDIQNISRVLYKEEMAETYEYEYKFLHKACMNKKVTLDIVKYLMDTFPDPKGEWAANKFCPANYDTKAYPIHCACSNKNCPTSVIEYLMDKFPSTLQHLCAIRGGVYETHDWDVKGLPLHYYLAWNSNIDIDIVKMMIETYPQSLMTSDEDWPCYPIHLVLSDQHWNINQELLMYLLELEPASIHMIDGNNATLLHLACYNEHLTLEIYQFIFNKWPEAIRMRDNLGSLPIHALSMTNTLDEDASIEILQSMLDIDPMLARDIDEDSFEGHRPIDRAVKGRPFGFCKVLIDVYPESLSDSWPIFEACGCSGSDRDDLVDTIQYMLDIYPEIINARDGNGMLPIHRAAQGKRTDIVELLLKHDPDAASKKTSELTLPYVPLSLPLHVACERGLDRSVKILYDAYPEAIIR